LLSPGEIKLDQDALRIVHGPEDPGGNNAGAGAIGRIRVERPFPCIELVHGVFDQEGVHGCSFAVARIGTA
jgi:hypothetical protein